MNKYVFILGVTVYFGIISKVALSLGITTSQLTDPVAPAIVEDPSFLESVANVWKTATENVGSFIQIISFQTTMPDIINVIFFIPPSAVALFMLLSFLRGTN